MMNKKLHRLASEFYKISGVIEVPPALLKKVEDWAVGRYNWYAARALEEKIEVIKIRNQTYLPLIKSRDSIYYAISVIENLALGEPDSFNKFANQNFPFVIPYSSFEGAIGAVREPSLLIDMVETKNGKYNIKIKIRPDHEHINPVNVRHMGVSEKEIHEILRRHLGDIQETAFLYFDFVDKLYNLFYLSKENDIQGLYLNLAIMKKHQVAGGDHKAFTIMTSELPSYFSNLNLPVDKVSFDTYFITDETERKEIYNKMEWDGLWYPSNIRINSDNYKNNILPLGTIYIYIDLKKKENLNFKNVNFHINNIKGSVRHELQHMIQSSIKHLKDLKERGGIPGRKLRNEENVDIIPIDSNDTTPQELKDIEFYTHLTDAIHDFNSLKKAIPLMYHQKFAKAFTGLEDKESLINELHRHPESGRVVHTIAFLERYLDNNRGSIFFNLLKEKNKLKFKKAVKEFMKAVL